LLNKKTFSEDDYRLSNHRPPVRLQLPSEHLERIARA